MREIGSEFWCGCAAMSGEGIAPYLPVGFDIRMVLSGRTALELVVLDALQEAPIQKAYIPAYCCHTMIEPLLRHGIQVEFYGVYVADDGLTFDFDGNNDCDLVLLMDYFGFISEETATIAAGQKAQGKRLVYDATHAVFCEKQKYAIYDYVIASFRKWLPVNAAFCAKQTPWLDFPALRAFEKYQNMRQTAFALKADFMANKSVEKQNFLTLFRNAEELLETNYSFYAADPASVALLKSVNVAGLRRSRRENAQLLLDGIAGLNSPCLRTVNRTLGEYDCPLFVPLFLDTAVRDKLRSYMITENVYLPVHWGLSSYHEIDETAKRIYRTTLSCVCDQRYNTQDMQRLLDLIRGYF